MTRSFYEVLGVPEDASGDAITEAYRERVKEHHPDVSEEPDAEERFKRIKRAEEVLTDGEERARYDRLGHERYVTGATAGEPTADSVRTAAAWATDANAGPTGRSAGEPGTGRSSAGGRSAGWRERERRARGSPEDWFQNDVGYDASSGSGWRSRSTGGSGSDGSARDGTGDAAGGASRRGARRTGSDAAAGGAGAARGAAGARHGGGSPDSDARAAGRRAGATGAAGAAGAERASGRGAAAARGHAATEAWGNRESRPHTHAVHQWREATRDSRSWVPSLSQDEFVFLGASILVYPLLLAMTVFPPFPLAANAALGLLTLAYVTFLLPRPVLALPIFGTWSVGVPAILLSLGVPLWSPVGAIGLIGTWVPFGYSLAVAYVLVR